MSKIFSSVIFILTLAGNLALAQVPGDLGSRFARATITANEKPLLMGTIFKDTEDSLIVMGAPLVDVIARAYGVRPYQIVGAPEWVHEQHLYDIDAVPPPPELVESDEAAMLRSLLVDRFKLQTRHETREVTMLVLDVDREKQRELAQKAAILAEEALGRPAVPPADPGAAAAVLNTGIPVPLDTRIILGRLERNLGEPVYDLTVMQSLYLIANVILPNGKPAVANGTLPSGAPFTYPLLDGGQQAKLPARSGALFEQTGLILDRRMVSLDVLVVTHLERPVLDAVDR